MNDIQVRSCVTCGCEALGCDMHQFEQGHGRTTKMIYYCGDCCPRCNHHGS